MKIKFLSSLKQETYDDKSTWLELVASLKVALTYVPY
jgi:hypothetical protein